MDFLEQIVGGRISKWRRSAGWSQARLAERVNVSTETISRLETGATMPSLTRLAAIARAFGVDLPHLVRRGEDDEQERALEYLRAVMSRWTPTEIDLIATLAGPILDLIRQRRET